MTNSADTLKIIQGLSQVQRNTHDGARDADGKLLDTGLSRDQEVDFRDPKVMDGFRIKLSANTLRLTYHTEFPLHQTLDKRFHTDVEQTVADVISYIKKEYKKVTGDTLTLTQKGDMDIEMSHTSSIRNWVVASCLYEIGGIDNDNTDQNKKDLDKAVKDWLALGRKDSKKDTKNKADER